MKRLSDIVELMGGTLSYECHNGEHIYTVQFYKYHFNVANKKDSLAQKNVESNLSEVFPIQYQNAVNQLK